MLVDVTSEDRMDEVSSQGYAWGYIGSCVPFVICLLVVLNAGKIGITMETAMMVSFVIITVWWVIMTLPLLKTYHQKYYVEKKQHAFSESFKRIGITLKNVKKEKKVFLFLLAFFFYIDGVYTIIDMATAYGSALGLSSTGFPICDYFRKTCEEIFCRKADHSMHRGIPWSGNFCDFSALPVAVLGSCSLGRYVPGRCAGAFKILLYEDYTGEPVR